MRKIAIIGYGGMGSWHCRCIKDNFENDVVKGICDVRPERCELAKENGYHVYNSLDEILKDEEITLTVVATPNDSHKNIAIKCLKAGKNVVLEKPATLSAAEFEEVVQVANETGKVLTVHQNRRWDRDFNIVKSIYDKKLIGDIYMVETRVQGSRQYTHGWRSSKINGGGMVYDWGVHLIDQLLQMIQSKVVSVYSNLFCIYADEVDDNFKVILKFENSISVLMEVSMNCFILHPRWHISGSIGTAKIENWDCEGKITVINKEEELPWEEKIVYTAAGPTRSMAPRPVHTVKEIPLPEVKTDLTEFYKNVFNAIDNKEELLVKHDETLRVLKIIDAIFESDRKGESIKCNI